MANLADIVPDVLVAIPQVTSFVAERQLQRAARIFCEESRAWRYSTTIDTDEDTSTVVLALPIDTELVDVISIKNSSGGRPVVPRTYAWLDENLSDWRGTTATDAIYYVLDGNNTLRFVYTPDATVTGKYYARLALKPTLAATTIDDVVANKYDEVLVNGALARLYLMPKKAWSDPDLAIYHETLFISATKAARTEAADEFQTGIPRKVNYGGL